jgi:CheY-like chemotaxis protein
MVVDDNQRIKNSCTVLLVDDELIVIEPICELLKRLGYKVKCAASGEQAIDLFKQEFDDIDVVILDMLMPGMNGKEAFLHIRKIRPEIPVIFASGYNYKDQINDFIVGKCSAFIQKPYRGSDLHFQIQKMLADNNSSAEM